MAEIDKEALKRLAEAATAGEWVYPPNGVFGVVMSGKACIVDCCVSDAISTDKCRSNAKYIAAANPATILSLLAELEAKEKEISANSRTIAGMNEAYSQLVEDFQRINREIVSLRASRDAHIERAVRLTIKECEQATGIEIGEDSPAIITAAVLEQLKEQK